MENYNNMLVPELDDILEERGLSTSGLKMHKVHRLEKYDLEMPEAGEEPEVKNIYVKSKEKPYEIRLWNGIRKVYVCTKCGRQEDKKDDAILHYLSHYPKEERDQVLDNLVKEL